jgi:hypothetical protein
MTLNEALVRQNFLSKIVLRNNENELSKELKIKIIQMRAELNKLRNQFEADSQEVIKELKPEGFDALYVKEDKTEEEIAELNKLTNKLTDEHNTFVLQKGKEEVSFDKKFTLEEYGELMDVNYNEVEINGNRLPAEDFLEIIYSLFVD